MEKFRATLPCVFLSNVYFVFKGFEFELTGSSQNVFLSGGFAESEHLFKAVKDHAASYDIDVQRPKDW